MTAMALLRDRCARLGPWLACALLLASILGACSKPPQPRVDGKPTASPPREPSLPPPAGNLGDAPGGQADEVSVAPPDWVPGGDMVRIGLRSGSSELVVESLSSIRLENLDGQSKGRSAGPGRLRVRSAAGGIEVDAPGLGPTVLGERALLLRSSSDGVGFEFKGNEYAGDLLVRKESNGSLTLINLIDLESYLRGVVPWEIGRPGPEALEAVKAQAIAARTYTVAHLDRRGDMGFDLWDSVEDQVFRGMSGTHPVTDRAVRETRGQVLRYEGELVQAYYSSTCGGHTAAIQDVWRREPIPYLEGIRDAPSGESAWCRESPQFRWTTAWSAKELGDVIREYLPAEVDPALQTSDIGVLQSLEVLEYDRSGRVQRLEIRTDRGQWIVWGDRVRWVLRPVRGRFPVLRSALFRLEEYHDDQGELIGVRLQGGGFGHGIGLCQTGALAMARAGRNTAQILQHYYPATRIQSLPRARVDWGE